MKRDAAITIRLPAGVKRRLESRARSEHRSLSAQVVADLEQALEEHGEPPGLGGSFLGRFAETRVPSDEDLAEARRLLWGRLRSDG